MVLNLKFTDYSDCLRIQKELVAKRKLGEIEDSIILTEHRPIFTIGRAGSEENLLVGKEVLKSYNIEVLNVDRGGDVTFHGPEQLVIYPIIDLKLRCPDLHKYSRDLEEVIIDFLSYYSVVGERVKDRPGVWVKGQKIAFIGIGVSNWVTYHGLSINIDVDLSFFSMIRPCGFEDIEVTSLSKVLNRRIDMDEAKARVSACFKDLFKIGDSRYLSKNYSAMA